jgi:hypothetical protein
MQPSGLKEDIPIHWSEAVLIVNQFTIIIPGEHFGVFRNFIFKRLNLISQ